MFIERNIKKTILDFRSWFPIVYVGGPRQSGKTTLLRHIFPDLPYSNLENADVRLRAESDPIRFLQGFPKGAILDEAQRVPILFNYLQGMVDEDKNLRFLLSGSQNFLMMESITQSLAGRVGILNLLPFSFSEIKELDEQRSLMEWVWRGGFPAPSGAQSVPPNVFFNSYVQTYIERDVRFLKNIGNISDFSTFLRLCAGRVGQPLNMNSLALDVGVSPNTIKSWISILEASYLVFRLPPYFENFNKRLIRSPKLYFFDTGLVCNLLGITSESQLETHFAFGNIMENAIIADFYKKRANRGERPNFWFWQDQKGNEVDLLIEEQGKLFAIEIKSSKTYNSRLLKGLKLWKKLKESPDDQLFLVYAGEMKGEIEIGQLLPWRYALEMI